MCGGWRWSTSADEPVLLAHAPERIQAEVLSSLERGAERRLRNHGSRRTRSPSRPGSWPSLSGVEEMTLGACSVAVPVRRDEAEVVAAFGIVVPSLRRDRPRLVAALQVAAHGIGRSISGGP